MEAVIDHDGIRVQWDARRRIVEFRYADDTRLTPDAADVIIPRVARWVEDGHPYGILVDASDTVASNEGWRRRWAAFHKSHASRVHIAVFKAGPFIQGYLLIYTTWSGVPLRCFHTEREARAWLAERVAA